MEFYGGKNPAPVDFSAAPSPQNNQQVVVPPKPVQRVAQPVIPSAQPKVALQQPAATKPRAGWVLPVIIGGAVLLIGVGFSLM